VTKGCNDVDFSDCDAELIEEAFEEGGGLLKYHQVILDPVTGGTDAANGGSTINNRWGYVEELDDPVDISSGHPNTDVTEDIPYIHQWFVPNSQHKSLTPVENSEFTNDYDQVVHIPAKSLIDKGISISNFNRDNSYFELEDGRELRIESVLPTPVSNPVSVRFLCTNRKPIDE